MNTYCEASASPFQVQAFDYPAITGSAVAIEDPLPELDNSVEIERARNEGIREGESRARQAYERSLSNERRALTNALEEFARDRKVYYHKVEAEVVQLTLAIARKILLREAHLDPLLLAGMVHVALEKIEEGTRTALKVNPVDTGMWQQIVTGADRLRGTVSIEGDVSVPAGTCRLETGLEATELGIEPQLKEIESGLLDILSKRPRTE